MADLSFPASGAHPGRVTDDRRPTMQDVAARAGVALSSVSRALSDHPDVSPAMRARVLQAVEELGYEPDLLAQSLRRGSTNTVGFVVRDISNPFFAEIATGAEAFLRSSGYSMLLTNSDGDVEIEARHAQLLRRRRVDGLILSLVSETSGPSVEALRQSTTPSVLLDRTVEGLDAATVASDHYSGVRSAVEDLLSLGHRRIALVSGPRSLRPIRERVRGLTEPLAAMGIEQDPRLLLLGSFDSDFARKSTVGLLDSADRPTAFIGGGVPSTLGVLAAMADRGIVPGEDIALVACDEFPFFDVYRPPLSVVIRSPRRLGAEAARLLLDVAAGGPIRQVAVPTEFRRRSSSCRVAPN